MPFVKGQSGNPSGRAKVLLPDGRALSDIAKEHTVEAMETLVSVLSDEEAPHAARVSAAKEIFDRGWGRPKQEIDATVDVTGDMIAGIIAQRRQRVAEIDKEGPAE